MLRWRFQMNYSDAMLNLSNRPIYSMFSPHCKAHMHDAGLKRCLGHKRFSIA